MPKKYLSYERLQEYDALLKNEISKGLETKQNTLTGTAGQVVGFDTDGNAVAMDNKADAAAIIDVIELPTENINEDVFYRVLSGSLVYDQMVQNAYTVYCVNELPEVGEPATNADQTQGNVYYNIQDRSASGYVDATLASLMSVPEGWYPAETLLQALGYSYSGVITDIMDDPRDDTFRLLLEYVVWQYKDGNWTSLKPIGRAGTGASSEVFNHPSNKATGVSSHAEGYSSHAEGSESHAEGDSSHAEGQASHAEGYSSHAEGHSSHAEGHSSHAEGDSSHAEGDYSHAEGYSSHAEGNYSHAEGHSSHAEGNYSHAEGHSSHAEGSYSHAQGMSSHAEGTFSHAEGQASHAEGYSSHAEGYHSHAEGGELYRSINITGEIGVTTYAVSATTDLLVGMGMRRRVLVSEEGYSHSVLNNYTSKITAIDTANNTITVDETLNPDIALTNEGVQIYAAEARGYHSHSEGKGVIAAGRAQHAQGEYNEVDPEYDVTNNNKRGKYAHIVGNGVDHTTRSNAHTLDWNGLGWFQGGLKVGGTGQDDEEAKNVLLEGEAIRTKCIHKETGDITDLAGTKSCRYIIGNEVTGMPIENEWWTVDFLSNGNTDAALTAHIMREDALTYVRYLVNDVWTEWKRLVNADSNGYIGVAGVNASEKLTVANAETSMELCVNGLGSTTGNLWIDEAGDAYFGEVYVGTKDNYTKLLPPRFADNITGGVENDTFAFWVEKGPGYCWISELNQINSQPNQYGFLVNYVSESDVFQIFRDQSNGKTYFRSGDNVNGWFQNWTEVVTFDNNGYLRVPGLIAPEYVTASDGESNMTLYPSGIGSNNEDFWIKNDGNAWFTKVYVGTKDNYNQLLPTTDTVTEGSSNPVTSGAVYTALNETVPVSKGGTGATTAAQALINLGITSGETDLEAGVSELATGSIYLVYE